jgi:hypothetical protein
MPKELTAYELELLKIALPFAQQLKDKDEELSRDALSAYLHCGHGTATNLIQFIKEQNAVKVANRRQALPERAEDRAVVDFALGDTSGSGYSHVLRENIRLKRQIAKQKFEDEAGTAAREQKIHEELLSLMEQAQKNSNKPVKIERPKTPSGNALEVNISDHHFGKLAWGIETGGRPYDVKIAIAMYKRALGALIERSKGYTYDEILFVVGNDLLNSNDAENKTAHGTIVTTDGRYHKTFRNVRETLVDAIEELRKIAPVKVFLVYGNHDTLSAYHMGDSLACYFHKYTDVTIQNEPTYRKYYQFGKNMLLLTHGDKGKREDFPLLMATEQPKMWADTMFREAHTGHIHQTKLQEWHGVRVRVLPALCPPDDWHSEEAYVGQLRSAEAYIWNREEGLLSIVFYNDDSQTELRTKREIV